MANRHATHTVIALSMLAGCVWQAPVRAIEVSPPADRQALGSQFISYTLNPGTAIQVLLQTPLNTTVNQQGDPVEAIMTQTIYLGEDTVLPISTRFKGVIKRLEPAIQGRNAILEVQFTSVLLANGEKLPITAHVRTEREDHLWGGEVTRGSVPMASVQRVQGIGEYNRIVFGGPRIMGNPIKIRPGEFWTIILEQPLTIVKPTDDSGNL